MTIMRTRVAGWPLRILVEGDHSISRFTREAGDLPQQLRMVYLQDQSFIGQVKEAFKWYESDYPRFIQPWNARFLNLMRFPHRESHPLPLPQVTEPDPSMDHALWFRGCRISKIEGYSDGCVEVEFITQGGERSVDCVPLSEVTIRPFRK